MLKISNLVVTNWQRRRGWVLILCFWLSFEIQATEDNGSHERLVKRASFLVAERLLRGDRLTGQKRRRVERIIQSLGDYPLIPYLKVKLIPPNTREAWAWLGRYSNAPFNYNLRERLLRYLLNQRDWQAFFENFPTHPPSDHFRCLKARALIGAHREEEAQTLLRELWVVGHSQSSLCDPAFMWWHQVGGLNNTHIWQRIRLAMEEKNLRLVAYLTQRLPRSERALVRQWQVIYDHPHKVVQLSSREFDKPKYQDVLLYGFRRWSIKAPEAAAMGWRKLVKKHSLNSALIQQIEYHLGLSLAKNYSSLAEPSLVHPWLFQPFDKSSAELLHWRVATAAREGRWARVLETLDALGEGEYDRQFLMYWRARALEGVGELDKAREFYEKLRQERSYYGFIAADRLGVDYLLNYQPLVITPEQKRVLADLPAMERAVEWRALGRMAKFRREWRALVLDSDPKELTKLGKYASQQEWHAVAITTVARAKSYDDLVLRFPLVFSYSVTHFARHHDLNPAWVFAVIRQESAFVPRARSGKGAVGLMQIMPRTAREIGRRLKVSPRMKEPRENIRFGSFYLKALYDRLSNHQVLANAAYNAGPGRVRRWLPKKKEAADIWVEMVPFRQTRSYIKRVLFYQLIYEARLGRITTRLEHLLKPIPARTAL